MSAELFGRRDLFGGDGERRARQSGDVGFVLALVVLSVEGWVEARGFVFGGLVGMDLS